MIQNIKIKAGDKEFTGIVSEGVSYGYIKDVFSLFPEHKIEWNSAVSKATVDGKVIPNQFILKDNAYVPISSALAMFGHGVKWQAPDTVIIYRKSSVSQALKGLRIAVDKGHGGNDPGAVDGIDHVEGDTIYTKEEDINYIMRDKIINLLKERGAEVLDVVPGKGGLSLTGRAKKANQWRAYLFISLHNNAATNSSGNGFEIFCASFGGISHKVAVNISDSVREAGIYSRGVKTANYTVLHATDMPAVLVEGGFITNPQEERLLNDDAYLNKLCLAIVEGVERSAVLF
jgi:N-acetylmuramoyl-L-alanine amidase